MIVPQEPRLIKTEWVIEYIKARESTWSEYAIHDTLVGARGLMSMCKGYPNMRLIRREIREYMDD